jgi:hypothetical protein
LTAWGIWTVRPSPLTAIKRPERARGEIGYCCCNCYYLAKQTGEGWGRGREGTRPPDPSSWPHARLVTVTGVVATVHGARPVRPGSLRKPANWRWRGLYATWPQVPCQAVSGNSSSSHPRPRPRGRPSPLQRWPPRGAHSAAEEGQGTRRDTRPAPVYRADWREFHGRESPFLISIDAAGNDESFTSVKVARVADRTVQDRTFTLRSDLTVKVGY